MITIKTKIRKKVGKSASRFLRRKNIFPAIVYGNNISSILIEIDHNHISNIKDIKKFYKLPIILVIQEKKIKVKVHKVQNHPFKNKIMHIDFLFLEKVEN